MIDPKIATMMYLLMQSQADKKAIEHLDFDPEEETDND